ncbi:uncharacterized protein LOC129753754 [Uranotaenia lowii]|uniref:uncharacterized protein LOC129753754 n=1 Tax=Uranotaenia lowii TaxID=190385 RepID=UPI00247A2C85|nr:uncharacterized protein LOC129753754 [Uranotaenia lowii]
MRDLKELYKLESNLCRIFETVRRFISSANTSAVRSEIIGVRIERLDDAFKQFQLVRSEIELQTDQVTGVDDPDEELSLINARAEENYTIATEKEDDFCNMKGELLRLQSLARRSENDEHHPATSTQDPIGSSASLARVKLPEIRLPSFDGQIDLWITFRDSFDSLINSNHQLTQMDKFTYLRSALTGEALREVSSIELTAANYQVAWDALTNRYENRKLIVKTYVDALFKVEIMRKECYDGLSKLIGGFEKNLQMLEKIGESSDGWSTLLVHMVCARLDPLTLRHWETHHNSREVPKFQVLIRFLKDHCSILQTLAHQPTAAESQFKRSKFGVSHPSIQFSKMCPFCGNEFHSAFRCIEFLKCTVEERSDSVKRARLCLNCLSPGHMARVCSKGSCHHCGSRHHSLLHPDRQSSVSQIRSNSPPSVLQAPQSQPQPSPLSQPIPSTSQPFRPPTSTSFPVTQMPDYSADFSEVTPHTIALPTHTHSPPRQVLLSTAIVRVQDQAGNFRLARALLDSCSQFCFMSTKFCQRLKFRSSAEYLTVQGIGGSTAVSKKQVVASVSPRCSGISTFVSPMTFYVLPEITTTLPASRVPLRSQSLPNGVILADPNFFEPGQIDLIIGAEFFFDILTDGRFKVSDDGPSLQNSVFGWIVAGTVPDRNNPHPLTVTSCSVAELQDQLAKFWELETCRTSSTLSVEESVCETLFEESTIRDSIGRFVVSLPKRNHVIRQLGETRSIALRRFYGLEKRFLSDKELHSAYKEFIEEYVKLDHMQEVRCSDELMPVYYLPHHAVFKPDSSTTKLRVVFDASCKSSTGVSLNDGLMVGPVVQEDLLSIVLRFRLHRVAVVADVEKMYRMIRVQPEDQRLQRILWRNSPNEPIRTYQLTTVTYGTASAPYLATKSLRTLAEEGEESYPRAASSLKYDTYVDDSLTGANSVEDAKKLSLEMVELAATGGFTLRKFNSNSAEVLSSLPEHLVDDRALFNLDSSSASVKTLGLMWRPSTDSFLFQCPVWDSQPTITKRIVLADTARLFDPLGLVGPVVILAKIFLQDLWQLKCGWDEPLPENMQAAWQEYRRNLAPLSTLVIPRWLAFHSNLLSVEIHGFCDASVKAYGACLYLRSTTSEGEVSIQLITAKSRVAPLDDVKRKKKQQTIPRLELSSALLLSHVYEKVKQSLRIPHSAYFWTDSTIVLCWLSSLPSRWQVFVSNRVSEIQHITKGSCWQHISGVENPADIISRGMIPAQLLYQSVWFHGPLWLRQDCSTWPRSNVTGDVDPSLLEERKVCSLPVAEVVSNPFFDLRESYINTVHIVSWSLRFLHNVRIKNPEDRVSGSLSVEEHKAALHHLVRLAQAESFPAEVEALQKCQQLKSTSSILPLNPCFVDGIIRVGGRLQSASISQERKHPMILSNQHPFSRMIVNHYHHQHFHAGAQLLVSSLRERFWIIRIRSLVNTVLHECVHCFRNRPRVSKQLMGELPVERVSPAEVFDKVGVDYCGPFLVRYPRTQPRKHFVAIFVCLATKAVHIELVADLTSEAFIAAFKRFSGRRGKPSLVMCDNATTFVGAKRQLDELHQLFTSQQFQRSVTHEAVDQGTEFRFIPARTPNFGGLWEAAVKSFKTHLKRTIGCSTLQFDEMHTVVVQIEAILNSRPLTPISNDPNDFEALTPGHFLIKRPLTAVPEPSKETIPENRLFRWQRAEDFYERIWKRWSTQYLSDLHSRTKWTRQRDNISVGTMVLLKDEHLPPLKWKLGRVLRVHPGADGNIRVVDIKTQDSEFSRGIQKVCVLPFRGNPPVSAQSED